MGSSDGVGHHEGDRFGVLMVREKIGSSAGGSGDREPAKLGVLMPIQRQSVDANVGRRVRRLAGSAKS